jgi:hypothetical protein
MKTKLLILFAVVFSLAASCEPDTQPVTNTDCNCGVITNKIVFTIPNSVFTKLTIKNNCTEVITNIQVTGNQGSVGEQWCND